VCAHYIRPAHPKTRQFCRVHESGAQGCLLVRNERLLRWSGAIWTPPQSASRIREGGQWVRRRDWWEESELAGLGELGYFSITYIAKLTGVGIRSQKQPEEHVALGHVDQDMQALRIARSGDMMRTGTHRHKSPMLLSGGSNDECMRSRGSDS